MKINRELLNGVKILEPKVFGDERGYFLNHLTLLPYKKLLVPTSSFKTTNHGRGAAYCAGFIFKNHPKRRANYCGYYRALLLMLWST